MQDQLLIELKILSIIDHPNIVKAYESFTDDYHYFILMEYIQGISLTKKFKSK
jgi:serine/threonine protein kinase